MEIIIYITILIISFLIFKKILFKKIFPYNVLFWSRIEALWLLISFTAICFGIIELNRIKIQFDYNERENQVVSEYQEARMSCAGQSMYLEIDDTTPENVKESIQWFHKMQYYLDEGWKAQKWRSFLFYTRAFIFKESGFVNGSQNNQMEFEWPKNIKIKSSDIVFKEEIELVKHKLVNLKKNVEKYEAERPNYKPLIIQRYIFIFFFTIALSLKLLKTYADYIKSSLA